MERISEVELDLELFISLRNFELLFFIGKKENLFLHFLY